MSLSVNTFTLEQHTVMVLFTLNGTLVDSVTSHKDLGIVFDNHLKFHDHTIEVTAKANRLLGIIRKSFEYLEPDMLVKLFVSYGPYWNIVTLYGGHLLFWIRERLKKSNEELPVCYQHWLINPTLKDYPYYNCHP